MSPNRVRVACFLVAALLLSTASAGVVAGQNQVTLTVTVVDGDGDPVSGIDLSATWEDGGGPVNETTRSNGQALVDVPEGANVTVTVDDDEYVRNHPFELEDASTREVEIPVSEAGTATIDVVDGGGSVQGAIVQVSRDGRMAVNTRTGSDGQLTTDDLERGEYELRVWKEGYRRNATDLTVDGDVSKTMRIRQDSRLLSVYVTDDHFDPPQPVENATVRVAGSSVTTLSNGETTIQLPVNDRYEVSVTKDGYETNSTSVRVREQQRTANLTIQRTDAISLEPANERVVVGESVRVAVTDEYGDPVSGADVEIEGESAGQSDDDGVVTVAIDSAGTHNLTATSGDLEATASVEGVGTGDDATETDSATQDAAGTDTTTTEGSGPGFTMLGAVVALLGAGLLLRRR